MILNLDKEVLSLKGEPLGEKLSEVLANVLAMSNIGKPAKMITWAVNLMNNGQIDIDVVDAKFISELIEDTSNIVNLVKAQILEELDKLKE